MFIERDRGACHHTAHPRPRQTEAAEASPANTATLDGLPIKVSDHPCMSETGGRAERQYFRFLRLAARCAGSRMHNEIINGDLSAGFANSFLKYIGTQTRDWRSK